LPGAVAICADVTDRQGVQAMADPVVQQFGRIDVLVNNAGWDKASPFVDSEPADWDRAIAVNLYGVLHTCQAVLPIMAEQGSGAVHPARRSTSRPRAGSSPSPSRSPERWRATRSG
jgi:2-hydroxycyclohexanecarboxyl-CoA dehydrogenase